MTDASPPDGEGVPLTDEERARIRAEMRYAMLAAQLAAPPAKPRSRGEKLLAYLSNGFVLLLLGSLITSGLVPRFQRQYEARAKQFTLMQDGLTQFLLYSNSIWQEYYAILPLTLQPEINKDEYVRVMNEISQIKLRRYDAYAKTEAVSLVFRPDGSAEPSPVEKALTEYAVSVNGVSEAIDTWLGDLYCTPTKRPSSPCAKFDPAFDAYRGYQKIKALVETVGNERAQKVAELMVERIKSPH